MPKKNETTAQLNESMIENIQDLLDEFNENLEESMDKDAAAKRARKLSTQLAAEFKEFRAASVAFHNERKEERKAAKEAEEKKSAKKGKGKGKAKEEKSTAKKGKAAEKKGTAKKGKAKK